MFILALILYCICPVIAIPLLIVGLIKDKKHRYIYLLILAFFLSVIAFNVTPKMNEDLYRHHDDVLRFGTMENTAFINILKSNSELLSLILKRFIYKLGNVNYLQFFITFIDYSIVFYIINDYNSKKENDLKFIGIISLFTIISFSYMTIISNLFNTLALIIFSLGLYFDYSNKKNKLLCYILYISPILIHSSLILPLVILIIFKITGNKVNLKNIIIIFVGLFLIPNIISILNRMFSFGIINEINSFYKNYFINQEQFGYLHTTRILFIYMIKLIPYFVAYFFVKDKNSLDDFSMLVLLIIITLFFQSTFSIRYIPIVQLCGLPMICKMLKNISKKNSYIMIIIILLITFVQIYFQYLQIRQSNFESFSKIITSNVINNFKWQEDI